MGSRQEGPDEPVFHGPGGDDEVGAGKMTAKAIQDAIAVGDAETWKKWWDKTR